jgi:6-phosphogluconate dehydrogenase
MSAMQLGMIGLGRMGGNMVRRLMRAGHQCVVYDVHPPAVKTLAGEGATGADSLKALVKALKPPRSVWLMVPAALVDQTLSDLSPLLAAGDTVIDGGNSYYHDDIRRAAQLKPKGIHYVDVGTSGGVFGLERGYCLMIGGRAAGAGVRHTGTRCRRRVAHCRSQGCGWHRRAGLPALWSRRRRALREDGA